MADISPASVETLRVFLEFLDRELDELVQDVAKVGDKMARIEALKVKRAQILGDLPVEPDAEASPTPTIEELRANRAKAEAIEGAVLDEDTGQYSDPHPANIYALPKGLQ